jgi:hypothetical protein
VPPGVHTGGRPRTPAEVLLCGLPPVLSLARDPADGVSWLPATAGAASEAQRAATVVLQSAVLWAPLQTARAVELEARSVSDITAISSRRPSRMNQSELEFLVRRLDLVLADDIFTALHPVPAMRELHTYAAALLAAKRSVDNPVPTVANERALVRRATREINSAVGFQLRWHKNRLAESARRP